MRNGIACVAIAAIAALSAGSAHAQARRADPPVRQPMLIEPIAPSPPSPPAPRARESPEPATRPAAAAPGQDRFYDETMPGLAKLQRANEALAGFPVDRGGFVDWIEALRSGRIAPRAEPGSAGAMKPHDLDVVLRNTKEMPWVRFPHLAHSQWLDCGSCHPAPFAEKAGATPITMERIFRGEACGRCHGKVAFPAWLQCERCHNVPREGRDTPRGAAIR